MFIVGCCNPRGSIEIDSQAHPDGGVNVSESVSHWLQEIGVNASELASHWLL